jgi:DNA-binding NarL/FixJ family response regulator
MSTYTAEQIEAIGGKPWTSRDGRITRTYLNGSLIARLIGLEVERYRTGNISSASIGNETISNLEANRILNSKAYLQDGELHIETGSRREDEIRAAIVAEIKRTTAEDDDDPSQSGAVQQVAGLRESGRTVRQIAEMIGVAVSTIYRWARGICRPLPVNAAALAALAI